MFKVQAADAGSYVVTRHVVEGEAEWDEVVARVHTDGNVRLIDFCYPMSVADVSEVATLVGGA